MLRGIKAAIALRHRKIILILFALSSYSPYYLIHLVSLFTLSAYSPCHLVHLVILFTLSSYSPFHLFSRGESKSLNELTHLMKQKQ